MNWKHEMEEFYRDMKKWTHSNLKGSGWYNVGNFLNCVHTAQKFLQKCEGCSEDQGENEKEIDQEQEEVVIDDIDES